MKNYWTHQSYSLKKEISSSTLKNIRGKGYSKLLTLLTTPEIKPRPTFNIRKKTTIPKLKSKTPINKSITQSTSYKISLIGNNIPSFPSKITTNLEISQHSLTNSRFSSKPACFPKRSLNCMAKKYANYKTTSSITNDDTSLNVSRLTCSPTRAKSRYFRLVKRLDPSQNNHIMTSSSSDVWDPLEPKNITLEYLNDI